MTRQEEINRSNKIYRQGKTVNASMISPVKTKDEKISGNNFTIKYNLKPRS